MTISRTPSADQPDDQHIPAGLTAEAWGAIGAVRRDGEWRIPERSAQGEIVGWARRLDNGGKRFAAGGSRGLTMPWPLDRYAGTGQDDPVCIVEGASDTAAGIMVGLDIVGRPSATGGADDLRTLLRGRHVAIIGEHDDAGRKGARKIARALVDAAASVRIAYPPEAAKDLRQWVTAPVAPASRAEVLAAIRGGEVIEAGAEDARHGPALTCMADVAPADIAWLWPGRIPLGRLTLLVGRPGDGKSFLTAHLAANVSRGRQWIDGTPCPAGSVVLCSAEDDPADTIVPRLIAHDADRRKVHLLTGVMATDEHDQTTERVFTLADLDALRQTLRRLDDCRLIVVDPIGSYLGGRADAHRDNEVRGILAPVAKLAAEHDAALVVVAHTRKAAAANADDMTMGSRAFTGLARSVLHLMIDPDDESKRRRLLLAGKNNLAERPAGLAFEIAPAPGSGPGEARPCLQWHEGEVSMTADEAISRDPAGDDARTERDEAADWLREALADGPIDSGRLKAMARDAGHSWATIRRAKTGLGIDPRKEGFGAAGKWVWALPAPPPKALSAPGADGVSILGGGEHLRPGAIASGDCGGPDAAPPPKALTAGRVGTYGGDPPHNEVRI